MIQWCRLRLWFALALAVVLVAAVAWWLRGILSDSTALTSLILPPSHTPAEVSPLPTPIPPSPTSAAASPPTWTGAGAAAVWVALGVALALGVTLIILR